MTASAQASLVEQSEAVRRKLLDQRLQIAQQLASTSANNGFPRSVTMRLLIRRPDLAIRLLMRVASLFRTR